MHYNITELVWKETEKNHPVFKGPNLIRYSMQTQWQKL